MITWRRGANVFARRISHENQKSSLASGFIVEQGTKALFFEDGVLKEIVGAGKIEFGGWLERLLDFSRNGEIVVCDAGDVHLEYVYGSIVSGEMLSKGMEMLLKHGDTICPFSELQYSRYCWKIHFHYCQNEITRITIQQNF